MYFQCLEVIFWGPSRGCRLLFYGLFIWKLDLECKVNGQVNWRIQDFGLGEGCGWCVAIQVLESLEKSSLVSSVVEFSAIKSKRVIYRGARWYYPCSATVLKGSDVESKFYFQEKHGGATSPVVMKEALGRFLSAYDLRLRLRLLYRLLDRGFVQKEFLGCAHAVVGKGQQPPYFYYTK